MRRICLSCIEKNVKKHKVNGAAGEARTHDLWLRRPLLYPTELLPHDILITCNYISLL